MYNKIHIVEAVFLDKEEAGGSLPTCELEDVSKEFMLSFLQGYICWGFWEFGFCIKVEKISISLPVFHTIWGTVWSTNLSILMLRNHACTVRNAALMMKWLLKMKSWLTWQLLEILSLFSCLVDYIEGCSVSIRGHCTPQEWCSWSRDVGEAKHRERQCVHCNPRATWLLVYQTKHTGQTTPSLAYLCAIGQESEQRFKNVGWRADIFSSVALVMKYHAREYYTDFVSALVRF